MVCSRLVRFPRLDTRGTEEVSGEVRVQIRYDVAQVGPQFACWDLLLCA